MCEKKRSGSDTTNTPTPNESERLDNVGHMLSTCCINTFGIFTLCPPACLGKIHFLYFSLFFCGWGFPFCCPVNALFFPRIFIRRVFFFFKSRQPQWTTHWSFHDPILGKCYEVSRPAPDPSSLKKWSLGIWGPLINGFPWGYDNPTYRSCNLYLITHL